MALVSNLLLQIEELLRARHETGSIILVVLPEEVDSIIRSDIGRGCTEYNVPRRTFDGCTHNMFGTRRCGYRWSLRAQVNVLIMNTDIS